MIEGKFEHTNFKNFFKQATGFEPYPYQETLAENDIPDILNISTGAGKTEAAILALYIWRCINPNKDIRQSTPIRLVYCLPMRVLVEQTVSRITKWIENLQLSNHIKVVTLMGGNVKSDYKLYPECNAIIIGTQDMLLSRALNRGYSMSKFQWPVEFGLLNNDCLWIMDEIQLMHNGLATSVQLEKFRDNLETHGPHKTVWMSATINPQWLHTVDSDSSKYKQLVLTGKDLQNKSLSKRNNAKKTLEKLSLPDPKDEYTKNDATIIKSKHEEGTITLVIVNTVKRAQSLFKELKKISAEKEIMLIHSRFRQKERHEINKKLESISNNKDEKYDLIIVSTQVVEAGVDISAKTLITEMAPWPSMVQRFGRCNRKGIHDNSIVYFIPLTKNYHTPYDEKDMLLSEKKLESESGKSVSPKDIPKTVEEITHQMVIRELDILQLFDTSSDLSGNYTDVSRFVRSLETTTDVNVLWRDFDENPYQEKHKVEHQEICSVPISQIKDFMRNHKVWMYNQMDGNWQKANDARPGQLFLINAKDGGYAEDIGWDVKLTDKVTMVNNKSDTLAEEFYDSDNSSQNLGWVTLNDHTVHVIGEAENILKKIKHLAELNDVVLLVAKYHDIGKAHHIFQETMTKNTDNISRDVFWAKRGGSARHSRKNFRHEAASALAFLKMNVTSTNTELAAYLIASHHGKVRLSMRSLPRKKENSYVNSDDQYLLGIPINDVEKLPIFLSDKRKSKQSNKEAVLCESVESEIYIDASIARIGKKGDDKSWLQISLGQLKKYGPFKLAYLEAIIRAADVRASISEGKK